MKLFFTLLVLFFNLTSNGQRLNKYQFTQRVNLRIGGGFDFQNGSSYDQILESTKSGLYGEGFIGYRFDENNKRANYFGLFGYVGAVNSGSLNTMNMEEVINIQSKYIGNKSYAYEIEGGFILNDWFRISAGKGLYTLTNNDLNKNLNYYSATSSIIFGKKVLNFSIKNSIQFGGDLQKLSYRLGAGLTLNFIFLKTHKLYN